MQRVVPPTERTCLRCGRTEVWDDSRQTWTARTGETVERGTPHCVHEWDITGNYIPLAEDD